MPVKGAVASPKSSLYDSVGANVADADSRYVTGKPGNAGLSLVLKVVMTGGDAEKESLKV